MKIKGFDDNAFQESQITILNEPANDDVEGGVLHEIITQSLRLVNRQTDRAGFLREGLFGVCSKETIGQIIENSVSMSKLPLEMLDGVAQAFIEKEERALMDLEKVDLTTYFSYMVRAFLLLLYLYGIPEIALQGKNGEIPLESVGLVMLCIGAGYGIHDSEYALDVALRAYRVGVKQRLIDTSLTKGGLHPFVKQTEVFLEGYITQTALEKLNAFRFGGLSFQWCCKRLQEVLRYKE